MAQTKKAAPTDAELSAMFEGIGEDDNAAGESTAESQSTTKKVTPTSSNDAEEDDPLAELKSLAAAPRNSTSSRPGTPRLASATASTRTRSPAGLRSTEMYTPTTGSGRSSEEKAAAEAESQSADGQNKPPAPQRQPSGGSWWGGLSAMASAAVKQAEAAVKEIQSNEEAQRWAEQMKGNYGALRGIGMLPVSISPTSYFLLISNPCSQVANFPPAPFRLSPISYTLLHLQYHNMNVFRSTLRTTSSITLLSIL